MWATHFYGEGNLVMVIVKKWAFSKFNSVSGSLWMVFENFALFAIVKFINDDNWCCRYGYGFLRDATEFQNQR